MARRTSIVIGAIAALVAVFVLAAAALHTDRSNSPGAAIPTGSSVVLYCATDREIAQDLIDQFEKETGIHVEAKFDTEAAKAGRPRAGHPPGEIASAMRRASGAAARFSARSSRTTAVWRRPRTT